MRKGWWRFWRRGAWRGWTSDRDALRGYRAARAELPRQITAKSAELADAQQARAQAKLAIEWAGQVRPKSLSIDLDEGEIAYATIEGVSLMEKRWRDGEKPWTPMSEGSLHFTDRRMIFDGEHDLDFAYADWTDTKPWASGFHIAVGTRLTLAGPIDQLEITLAAVQAVASGVDPKKTLKQAEREAAAVVGDLQDDMKRLNWTLGALRQPTPPRSPAWALSGVLVLAVAGTGSSAILNDNPVTDTTTTVPVTQPVAMAPTTTTEALPADVVTVQGALYELATVVSVTDGETVQVRLEDGKQDLVRLIGIDAPDASSPFSSEARAYLEDLVAGQEVWLVSDTSDRDELGRLLRYVYVGSEFINLAMVERGFAMPRDDPPDTQFSLELQQAGEAAEGATLGLWATLATAPVTTTTVLATQATSTTTTTRATTGSTTTTSGALTCHSSYTGGCVPAGVSDVDCAGGVGDGPYFVEGPIHVVGYDVYVLDVDGDGVACNT